MERLWQWTVPRSLEYEQYEDTMLCDSPHPFNYAAIVISRKMPFHSIGMDTNGMALGWPCEVLPAVGVQRFH